MGARRRAEVGWKMSETMKMKMTFSGTKRVEMWDWKVEFRKYGGHMRLGSRV